MKGYSLLIGLLLINFFAFGQIVINHVDTDITALSETEINNAKALLHVAYGHTSHGSQLIDGMNGLIPFANGGGKGLALPDDIFAWNNGGTDGALDLHDNAMGGDVGYYPDWYNNTISYLNNPSNSNVNVIMWSWCGQVSGKYAGGTLYSEFLGPMNQLEIAYPDVKFVYMTGHLDHGDDVNNKAANDSIRRHCQREGKILYDFSDIESYNPDGTFFQFAGDDCSYYDRSGTLLGNWAEEWRALHTQNVDWYNCGAQHSDALNANQKGYAVWALFVEIGKKIAFENIPPKLAVIDTIVGNAKTACFNATDTITIAGNLTSVDFQSGSSVSLIAGKAISFQPGFYARSGCFMNASITTNGVFCNGVSAGDAVAQPIEKSAAIGALAKTAEKLLNEKEIKVYPNPNKGKFTVELSNCILPVQIKISTLLGETIYQSGLLNAANHEFELHGLRNGVYLLTVSELKSKTTQKFIVQ